VGGGRHPRFGAGFQPDLRALKNPLYPVVCSEELRPTAIKIPNTCKSPVIATIPDLSKLKSDEIS
jgi:hypothetical protein